MKDSAVIKPVLEARGFAMWGWIAATWPFGYLQVYEDHIEMTSIYVKKENILSIKRKKFLLFLPGSIVFNYRDPIDKKIRIMSFRSCHDGKFLITLAELGYPVDDQLPFMGRS